ncbi:type II toxin-antitoxin system VapB family antitoxin [Pseudomonas sp. P5_152]|uniref:type II toxin-antitoxin system VapB family antitoxin n=1 Tax=Pseudomonas sp. P5_152 TaxID=3043442 RepID=UPI002A3621A5|nr:type II toxin-antitoxin system VapB family antitoxin [Pseudomonas sp. P5_152]MDX9666362.1 type II toxin-antitoxin system VapB family antitoxin [Pseudomonas sp. P5_152]
MEQTTLFLSNRSQAVRLPKAVAMPADVKRVEVIAIGRARLITPAGEAWDSWFDGETVTDDFMADREQPANQERELF